MDMAGIFPVIFRGEGKQPLPVQKIPSSARTALCLPVRLPIVNRQIRDPQGGNILKKMRSLRRIGPDPVVAHLDDGTDPGDVPPLHRNPEPRIC